MTNLLFQIRNVGTGLCVDTKHGALGSPLRLENCVKDRGEAAWNNVQVTDPLINHQPLNKFGEGEVVKTNV